MVTDRLLGFALSETFNRSLALLCLRMFVICWVGVKTLKIDLCDIVMFSNDSISFNI